MPTEKNLPTLIINEVESTAVYEEMKRQGLLNDDELYLVTDPENATNIDQVPTEGSKNLVYSGGVYDALQQAGSADSVNEWHNGDKQRFWRGTKEEYEALVEKPEDTLFILTDDEGEAVTGGDMEAAVYDPQGKAQDVFKYVDDGLATKAPTGYGLGEGAKYLDGVDLNTVQQNGWYWLSSTCVNAPTADDGVTVGGGAIMEVSTISSSRYTTIQRVYLGTAGQQGLKLRRYYHNALAEWSAWEWENPPLTNGVEYRTIYRIGGESVYVKNVNGVIQYHLDGETAWNPYAAAVGAAPAGYGLGVNHNPVYDLNNINLSNGFYTLSGTDCVNYPPLIPAGAYGTLLVNRRGNAIYQRVTYHHLEAVRLGNGSTNEWEEWEYVNPYFEEGVEYRTTERYNEEVVYATLQSDGLIHKRTESGLDITPYTYGTADITAGSASTAATGTLHFVYE